MKYRIGSHFKPADEREDDKMHRGHDVPNLCLHCGHPCMDHYNGQCPMSGEEDNDE